MDLGLLHDPDRLSESSILFINFVEKNILGFSSFCCKVCIFLVGVEFILERSGVQ